MSNPAWYEVQSDGSLLLLNFKGVIDGFDGSGNVVYGTLSVSVPSGPIGSLAPLAAELSQTAITSTSVTLAWTPPPFDERPVVTSWNIYRNGALLTNVSASTFSYPNTGLTTGVTYIYEVQGINANGAGDKSNQVVAVPGGGTTVTTPTAPSNFTSIGLTSTLASFTWVESADATVTKHGLFEGSTLVQDNIPANAVSYGWPVTPGSSHFQLGIARYNAQGWSPISNRVPNFTVPGGGGGIPHDPVMGKDYATGTAAPSYYTDWGALRVYTAGDLVTAFNSQPSGTPPRVLCYTANWSTGSTASAVETATRAQLETFYYGTGSSARQGCEVHLARFNEETRQFTSGTLPQIVIDHYAAIRRAVMTLNGDGVTRRFPLASVWVDLTVWGVTGQGAGPRFKPIAPYLDGVASSMYPPGRFLYDSRSGNNPRPWWTDYSEYVDPLLNLVVDWKTGNPNLTSFATWEIGIPIDKAGPNPPPAGQGNVTGIINDGAMGEPTNWGSTIGTTNLGVRPRYFTGGRAALSSGDIGHTSSYPLGANMVGFLQYVYNMCDAKGIIMREQLYWNRQDNTGAPNQFFHDAPNSVTVSGNTYPAHTGVPGNIDTAKAWHDWVPGKRLADL